MKNMQAKTRYAICIQNDGSEDLILSKVYQILADESAAKDGFVRVIDESGEDYLYPEGYFVSIALPKAAERALFTESSSSYPASPSA